MKTTAPPPAIALPIAIAALIISIATVAKWLAAPGLLAGPVALSVAGAAVATAAIALALGRRRPVDPPAPSALHRLAETNVIGAVVFDDSGRIHECNDAFLSLTGYSRRDASLGIVSSEWASAGLNPASEKQLARPDGKHLTALTGAAALPGDPHGRYVGYVLDLSERKRAEDVLLQSEARLLAAQELAQVGSWSWRIEDGVVEWSVEMARLFGRQPVEGAGTMAEFLAQVHPDDRDRLSRSIGNARRDGRRFSCEYRIQRVDGRVCTVLTRARTQFGPDGQVIRVEGTAQDVTEHREEEELFRYRDVLEQKLTAALDRLWLAYQPIVEWSQRRVFAHEALVRSDEPLMRNPSVLLRAAEKLGRTSDLGQRVRSHAASAAAPTAGPLLFVNLHVHDLLDPSLYGAESPLAAAAGSVVLEITERAGLEELKDARSRIAALRQMGYRIAVDDLGAGYSGLLTFAQLEPDFAKLDMSLVRDVHRDPGKRRLISGVAGLCNRMGIKVVAEGVETVEERDALLETGCDLLQGYLFAMPQPTFPAVAWEPVAAAS